MAEVKLTLGINQV